MSTRDRRIVWECRWDTGIYVGLVERSNEVKVATSEGIFKVNNVRRLPEPQRTDRG